MKDAFRRTVPFDALTDADKRFVTETLTNRAHGVATVAETWYLFVEQFYDPRVKDEDLKTPLEIFMDVFRRTSGSVDGEHRKDLVELGKGQRPPLLGLGIAPGADGNGGEGRRVEVKERSLL